MKKLTVLLILALTAITFGCASSPKPTAAATGPTTTSTTVFVSQATQDQCVNNLTNSVVNWASTYTVDDNVNWNTLKSALVAQGFNQESSLWFANLWQEYLFSFDHQGRGVADQQAVAQIEGACRALLANGSINEN